MVWSGVIHRLSDKTVDSRALLSPAHFLRAKAARRHGKTPRPDRVCSYNYMISIIFLA